MKVLGAFLANIVAAIIFVAVWEFYHKPAIRDRSVSGLPEGLVSFLVDEECAVTRLDMDTYHATCDGYLLDVKYIDGSTK